MKGKLLVATCFLPVTALAQDLGAIQGTVDAFYLPNANVEVRQRSPQIGLDEKGDGFGAKAFLHLNDWLMGTAEYQTVSYDDLADADRDDLRVGAGVGTASGSGLFGEYVSMEMGDGFGAHVRGAGMMGERLALYAQLGYVQVEDEERFGGFEFTVGGTYGILDMLGAFVDYRLTNLEGSVSQQELKFRDLRVGVRYTFGGGAGDLPPEGEAPVGVEPVEDGGEAPAEAPAVDEPAE